MTASPTERSTIFMAAFLLADGAFEKAGTLPQREVDCQRFGASPPLAAVIVWARSPPMTLLERIHQRAVRAGRHVVLPEGTEPRTLEAAARVVRQGLARVTLIGEPG